MSKLDYKDIQNAASISDMYQLLSILLHAPTKELVRGLLDASLVEDILSIFKELNFPQSIADNISTKINAIKNINQDEDKLLSSLRQEYTRLFLHPKRAEIAIYETMFLHEPENSDQEPMLYISSAAMDAERCYKKAGLVLSTDFNEPSDHMATEMEFMMYLYLEKAKAIKNNQPEERDKREAEIKEFEEIHLQKWASNFFQELVSKSENGFYLAVGEMGLFFIDEMLATKAA